MINETIDQVFRNTRADVLAATDNRQKPVEASQLTGNAFYMRPQKDFNKIDVQNILNESQQLYHDTLLDEAIDKLSLLSLHFEWNSAKINAQPYADVFFKGLIHLDNRDVKPYKFYLDYVETTGNTTV